jgi:hypothetical protein
MNRLSKPLPSVLIVVAAAILGSITGCSNQGSVSLQKVQGTVKFRGKILDHGQVSFIPADGAAGQPALSEIHADGTYQLQTEGREGVPPGKYRVLIQCRQSSPASEKPKPVPMPSLIPEKYAAEKYSPLIVEVKSSVNDYPLVLE